MRKKGTGGIPKFFPKVFEKPSMVSCKTLKGFSKSSMNCFRMLPIAFPSGSFCNGNLASRNHESCDGKFRFLPEKREDFMGKAEGGSRSRKFHL